jgi:hypothetical protein
MLFSLTPRQWDVKETNSMVLKLCLPTERAGLPRSADDFCPVRTSSRPRYPIPDLIQPALDARARLARLGCPGSSEHSNRAKDHIIAYCFTKDTGTCTTAAPPWGAEKFAEVARALTHSTTDSGKLPVLVAATLATCPVGPTLILS